MLQVTTIWKKGQTCFIHSFQRDHVFWKNGLNLFLPKFLKNDQLLKILLNSNICIKFFSNIYSLQSPSGSPINTSRKEIEIFLGVYFRMGLVKLPSQRSFWKTFMTYSGVSSVMGRNRFEVLFCNIHFWNNLDLNQEEKSNRLWKLQPWVNYCW